jgi:hypothetical protein
VRLPHNYFRPTHLLTACNCNFFLGSVRVEVSWAYTANIALWMSELNQKLVFSFFLFIIIFFGDTQFDIYFGTDNLQPHFQNSMLFVNSETFSVKTLLSDGSLTLKRDTWSVGIITHR